MDQFFCRLRLWTLLIIIFLFLIIDSLIADFSPIGLEGCILWLDAGDAQTVEISSDGKVQKWADKSGQKSDFTQLDDIPAPVISKDGIHGRPAIQFTGSEVLALQKRDGLDCLHDGNGASVFVVFESTEEHPRKYMAVIGNGGNDKKKVGFALAFNDSNVFHENNALAVQVSNGDGFTVNIRKLRGKENYALLPLYPNVVSFIYQANEQYIADAYVYGQKITNSVKVGKPSVNKASGPLAVGAADDTGQLGFTGKIAEVIIYRRVLSEKEREQVEQGLIEKYQIQKLGRVIQDKRCHRMGTTRSPCVVENDGTLLALEEKTLHESKDGVNWTVRSANLTDPAMPLHPAGRLMAMTPKGTLVSFGVERKIKLTRENNAFNSAEASFPLYGMRSLDGGRTWTDCRLIQLGYCGARDLIVTREGHIVLCMQKWDVVNERHVTIIHVSRDEGKTYKAAVIDNGIGWGLHDGMFESTITELSDGRLWVLGRTCLGVFWQSYSNDGGYTWSKPEPTDISAGSYPGYILRLKSGRQVLVWNRFYPEGGEGDKSLVGMAGVNWYWGKKASSRFSRELSIMFSSDDGKTWSDPLVLAEGRQDNFRLAYPKMLEIRPGEIYIAAGQMATKIYEKDFVEDRPNQEKSESKTETFRTVSPEGTNSFEVAKRFKPLYPVIQSQDGQTSKLPISFGSGHPIRLQDGSLFMVFKNNNTVSAIRSQDEGQSWSKQRVIEENPDPELRIGHPIILQTKNGTLWCFYIGWLRYDRTKAGSKSDIWAVRSTDGGKTWTHRQRIWEGYTGMTQGAIETSSGNILIPVCYVEEPTLFLGTCIYSSDGGQTWNHSAPIDIGRDVDAHLRKASLNGGTLEPSVAELPNGKILMLIRTITGKLWQSVSDDGIHWPKPQPTELTCGGPVFLKQLTSGRVALVWNQADWNNPTAKKLGYPHGYSKASIVLSDDGMSWHDPVTFAQGDRFVHSLVVETSPGKLLLTMPSRPVFLKVNESDLLETED